MDSSYSPQPSGSGSFSFVETTSKDKEFWSLEKLRKCYMDFIFSKRQELDEQIEARRYYHGSQWTAEQIKIMRKRKQPVMTFNRIGRKIDGVVGLIEKLRQDPKAYARTPQHEQGADLATAALRYVLDSEDWNAASPICAQDGAVDGIGGIELELEDGDQGDPDVGFDVVDVSSFFYDPRSFKYDFSDARYMGVGKWVDSDTAEAMFPDHEFSDTMAQADLMGTSDKEFRWYANDAGTKKIRLIDLWYNRGDKWCYAIFTGSSILMEDHSYLIDEKKKEYCKYIMFSGNVDQDGDRYGFIRNMKSAQDGINARQSKMQHILASRRLILSQGSVDDVEKARAEWARPDGVILTSRPVNEGVKTDDQSFDFTGWTKMLELNLQEIENFGPNPALVGTGVNAKSGRAIALMQQSGMAELGPYILAYRGWKIRVYRAIWNAIRTHWNGERWIRVTDDQDIAQYVQINGKENDPLTGQPRVDPTTGKPVIINPIGVLDVDIILDEGPDTVTVMQDMYETLSQVVPALAPMLSPSEARAMVKMLISSSPLDASQKKSFSDVSAQADQQGPPPDPAIQQAQAKAQMDAQMAQHSMQLDQAKAQHDAQLKQQMAVHDANLKQQSSQVDLEMQGHKTAAEIDGLRQKNAAALEVEREKALIAAELKKYEHSMKCDEMDRKAQHDQMSMDRKSEQEQAKADASEPAQLKAVAKSFEDGMKAIAEAMNAPKNIKVQRDKSGRVTGAVAD